MNQPSHVYPSKTVNKGVSLPTLIITFLVRFILALLPSPLLSQFLFLPFFSILILTRCLWEGFLHTLCHPQWSITNSSPMQCDAGQLWVQSVFVLFQASCSVSSCRVCFMCNTHYEMHTAAGLFSCQWVRSSMYSSMKQSSSTALCVLVHYHFV